MNFTSILSFLLSLVVVGAFNFDYPQYFGGYGAIRRSMLPSKNRRSALEGFDDISSMMRSIDGIQKPRFGRK
ncbi:unnamed protein product [Nippostrongylus brasiliensis]|uniref:Neuropeptide-Like Protein n=1 Tax=Nippostrongylus brasiliensis TaxID=27835 RepID=A0A0N4Y2C6_NIPBR|nr:unnamed protein product [Nippostrongylus brasiliensis]